MRKGSYTRVMGREAEAPSRCAALLLQLLKCTHDCDTTSTGYVQELFACENITTCDLRPRVHQRISLLLNAMRALSFAPVMSKDVKLGRVKINQTKIVEQKPQT